MRISYHMKRIRDLGAREVADLQRSALL